MDVIIISLLSTGRVSFYRYLKDGSFLKNPSRSCILFNKLIILTVDLFLWALLFHTRVARYIRLKVLLPLQCFSFKYCRVGIVSISPLHRNLQNGGFSFSRFSVQAKH